MKIAYLASTLTLVFPAVAAADAGAVDSGLGISRGAAIDNAVDISVGTGFAHGGGELGGDMVDLDEVAGAGGAVDLGVAYRILPNLSVGAYGTFSVHDRGDAIDDTTDVIGATAGVQATWHVLPFDQVDPWISLGTGWKGLWLNPEDEDVTSLHGLELARLQLGVDYRLSDTVSITPVIGGTVGMFVSEDSPMTDGHTEITGKEIHLTGYAGLSGRFSLGGSR